VSVVAPFSIAAVRTRTESRIGTARILGENSTSSLRSAVAYRARDGSEHLRADMRSLYWEVNVDVARKV